MPEVEVKLNIEAEYKQALQAIALMGKALEAVQAKAKNMLAETRGMQAGLGGSVSVTADAQGIVELQEAMRLVGERAQSANAAIAAMLELLGNAEVKSGGVKALIAEFERLRGLVNEVGAGFGNVGQFKVDAENIAALQEALRLVGVQAQNAQHALAGMVSVEGYDPDKLGVLNELVGIYRDLAVEAREAAMYAEKFAQAAPTLNQEGKDLEEKVKRLEEQIKGLQGVIAEREKEIEQLERSSERLDKHKKATEDDAEATEKERFAMELSVMTKQQLIAKIRELTKAQEAAAKAQDVEGYEHYTELLGVAKSKLRETNNELNLQKMAYLQQAQAVKQMSGTLEELGENVSTMGEAAEEGELDLVGMAEGAMEFYSQLKAGLGPMGWFMLALQQLQNLLNSEIQLQKELNALEQSRQDAIKAEADAYEAVASAMNKVSEEEEKLNALNNLQQAYRDINYELDTYNSNLDKTLEKLGEKDNLLKEEQKHQRELRKLQLEGMLTEGKITQDQYAREMLKLDEETAIQAAEAAAKRKKEEADIKGKKARNTGAALERGRHVYQETQIRKGRFKTDERVIEALMKEEEALRQRMQALEDKMNEAHAAYEESRGFDFSVGKILGDPLKLIIDLQGGNITYRAINGKDLFDNPITGTIEAAEKKLDAAMQAYRTASEALKRFMQKRNQMLGEGMTYESYLSGLEQAKRELEAAETELRKLEEENKNAAEEANKANEAATYAAESVGRVRKQAGENRAAREANLDARARADEKKEAEKFAERRRRLKGRAQDVLSYDREIREDEDKEAERYLRWLQKNGVDSISADGVISKGTAQKLLEAVEAFKRTSSKADDAVAEALLSMVKTVKGSNGKLQRKIEQAKYELGR